MKPLACRKVAATFVKEIRFLTSYPPAQSRVMSKIRLTVLLSSLAPMWTSSSEARVAVPCLPLSFVSRDKQRGQQLVSNPCCRAGVSWRGRCIALRGGNGSSGAGVLRGRASAANFSSPARILERMW